MMAIPGRKDARLYYRAAEARLEDAAILEKAEHLTGAVYMAGYGVECMLKALILESCPLGKIDEILRLFKGRAGHDFERLLEIYRDYCKGRPSAEIMPQFSLIATWSTDLRYSPKKLEDEEALPFLLAVRKIVQWIDGRI